MRLQPGLAGASVTSKWEARKPEIQRMVTAGMTDEEIGAEYGVVGQTIYNVRLRFGIASNFRRKRKTSREIFAPQEATQVPPEGETYTDKAGLTVTRYPARWARNALMRGCTARPRRG